MGTLRTENKMKLIFPQNRKANEGFGKEMINSMSNNIYKWKLKISSNQSCIQLSLGTSNGNNTRKVFVFDKESIPYGYSGSNGNVYDKALNQLWSFETRQYGRILKDGDIVCHADPVWLTIN